MKNALKKLLAMAAFAATFAPCAHAQGISGQINTIPGLPQATSIVATGAPQLRADGTASVQMADREGNTKSVLGHAEYTESARRGKIFTAPVTTTIVGAMATGGNIGTFAPIVGFYNPLGSGVNAVLLNSEEWHTSGTPGGPLLFNYFCGQTWNAAASGTIFPNFLSNITPGGSQMVVVNGKPLTTNPVITTAMNVLGPAGGPAAAAIATGTGETGHSKDWKGQIVIPPGCAFALAATATGTSDIVSASLTWEEVAP